MTRKWMRTGVLALLVSGPALAAAPDSAPMRVDVSSTVSLSKPVWSLKAARFRNVVQQQTDYSCGAAALATLLRYAYGLHIDEGDLIEAMMGVSDPELVRTQGFSMLDMKTLVEAIGLRGRGYQMKLEDLPTIRVPTISLVDYRGYKHFVIVQRATRDVVFMADPVLGNRRVPLKEFGEGWNGVLLAVIGPNYNRNNVLLTPPDPLRRSRMVNEFRPIRDADLMEFGFTQSDFF